MARKKIIPLEKKMSEEHLITSRIGTAVQEPERMAKVSANIAPPIKTPIISTVIQYAFLILLALICIWLYRIGFFHRFITLPAMGGPAVLFFAMACAFIWVEIWKWGVTKPFNCLKCMTGWFAVAFALLFHVEHWYLYLFAGVFVGAVFNSLKNRWL